MELFDTIIKCLADGRSGTLATITSRVGATPRDKGAKIFIDDGEHRGRTYKDKKRQTMKETIITDGAPQAIGPYAQAIKIKPGEMLFCSGQIPIDPSNGQIVEGPPEAQAEQVMKNLKVIIESCGFAMDDIVKTTIFLTDLESFFAVNKVYESYFHESFPARSTVQVSALPKDVSVEIEAITCK